MALMTPSPLPVDDNPEYVNVPSINLDLSAEVVCSIETTGASSLPKPKGSLFI